MEKQTIINAIIALNGTLGALGVSKKEDAINEVTLKILELVKQL